MSAGLPTTYAREKLPMLRRRWAGPEGDALERYGPTLWPGVPLAALMGLTASSMGMTEAVGDLSTSGSAMGLYGVEGPARTQLAADPRTVALLGRPAYTDARWATDYNGQTVVGLENYRRHLGLVTAALEQPLRPTLASEWAVRLGAGAYSVGPGGTASVVNHYAAELAPLPENARWQRLRELLERDAPRMDRIGAIAARGRYGAAFLAVRIDQRLESGRELAEAEGEPTAWWSPGSSGEALVALAYRSSSTTPTSPARSPTAARDDTLLYALSTLGAFLLAWRYLR